MPFDTHPPHAARFMARLVNAAPQDRLVRHDPKVYTLRMTMTTRQIVAMASVADVERSIQFYSHLGFEVGNTFAPPGATKLTWAWLQSGSAQLMVSTASKAKASPDQQSNQHTVLFYIYTDDVPAAWKSLAAAGLNPGEITTPFYSPRGEFELVDPDGYLLIVSHT